jgi:two-component system, chemotaxis family, sensor kinase CheA
MDVSEYLPMFLAEGREHLQALNLSLVRIEQDPRDAETINDIFRVAHTLKGMSATMGFDRMASLTHEMESVMEGMRSRSDGLGRDALDALFGCLDVLERMVDEIEVNGAESSDARDLVARLKQLHDAEPAAQAGDDTPGEDIVRSVEASGLWVARTVIRLRDDSDMPGVRAFLAVRAAEEAGELIYCSPDVDVIERGELDGNVVTIWIATAAEAAAISELVLQQEGIGACEVERVGVDGADGVAEPVPAPAAAASDDAEAAGPAAAGGRQRSQTVRVEADRLDLLMHLMGEMVVQRTRLESLASGLGHPELQSAVNDLSRVGQALQQMVMQVRMVPVESVFMRFPRMVRDIAAKLSKQVDLRIKGEDTELDRTVVEALGDPLVHLVRNAMDHGLEGPEERVAAGKPPTGTLEIAAEHAGGEVVIRVTEDGRGVDPAKVARIAVERGLIASDQADGLDMAGAIELLFAPGFSTASVATDISGRGVGMDAVRTMVRNLGGDCFVTSVLGAGSTATIRLPLSLAILPALLVEADAAPYALPLERVEQTIRLSDYALRSVAGAHAIVLRDRVLPLHDLGELLGGTPIDPATAAAVVVRSGASRIGLMVERLVGQQELVTRPLPAVTDGRRALVSGGAVLGDGEIALIVDLDAVGLHAKAVA